MAGERDKETEEQDEKYMKYRRERKSVWKMRLNFCQNGSWRETGTQ